MHTRFAVAAATAMLIVSSASLVHALAPAASDADKDFVGKVSQGGMYEVEASKVAAMRASAPDVKDLALTEVRDHEGVNARLKAIAAKTGVPVSATLNAEFQARLAKLKATAAADFDQAYVTDMQQIHDKDEKLFAQEAQEGSDAYKNFAHQTDLIVKRHIGALNAPVGN
jgi:putative membrane protein